MEISLDLRGALGHSESRDIPSRSLSYSGCWTCRERRTKCDERPVACKRCEDAKLVCAGYDIRLNWAEGVNQKRSRPGGTRRRIKPGRNLCQSMTDEEVTKALTVIDKATTDQPTMSGPFSVFHVEPEHNVPASQSSPGLLSAEETPPVQTCNNPNWIQDFVPRQEHQPFSNNDGSQWRQFPSRGGLAILSGEGISANVTEINIDSEEKDVPEQTIEDSDLKLDIDLLDEVILDASNGFSSGWDIVKYSDANQQRDHAILETESSIPVQSNWLTIQTPRPRETEISFSPLSHSLGSTIKNNSTTMLIHHYTHNIVHLMQPVSHRGNPFQTLYLPLAIEGSTATGVDQNSRGISPATVAVFHSLLCSAATNLQGLGSGESGLQQLAFRHKERALNALRSSLARKVGRYKDLMVAILSLVSADILDGGVNDHWIHLDAAIKLQASRHHASLVSRETSQLNMICTMLRLFAQTALPWPDPIPWSEDIGPDRMDHDFSDPSVEYIYGITTNLARLIKRIYRVTQHLAFYHGGEYPATLLAACEELGDHLSSWTIDSEPFSAIGTEREDARQIARAQARAFHSAALIYYYRSVQNCNREYLHTEQESTLLAMNDAEDLKLCLVDGSSVPAPLAWPAFIASCEATGEYRQRWSEWWARVERYRLKSFSKQHSIVQIIWEELDKSHDTTDWRRILGAMNFRIIPV